MTPRIEWAINVLLDSLSNNTLIAGNCGACAVGNLLMALPNATYNEAGSITNDIILAREAQIALDRFKKLEDARNGYLLRHYEERSPTAIKLRLTTIESPFTYEELDRIEMLFERYTTIKENSYSSNLEEIRADQLIGLNAVVEYLLELDEIEESVEEVFTSKAKLIPLIQ